MQKETASPGQTPSADNILGDRNEVRDLPSVRYQRERRESMPPLQKCQVGLRFSKLAAVCNPGTASTAFPDDVPAEPRTLSASTPSVWQRRFSWRIRHSRKTRAT